jgi:chorismate dehydratase
MRKVSVGAVSYLNTRPLIYGFEKGMMSDSVAITEAYPARIGAMLLNNEIDIGLVPVAIIPKLKECHIISDACIGADGDVASVCLFSDVPVEEIKEVLLDYQSRTSVALAKILLREHWKIDPVITDAREDFRSHIKGTTAGVVIGDRALQQRKISPYIYDLAGSWKTLTGLPFVFAAWISNKQLDPAFIARFNETTKEGLKHLPEIATANKVDYFDLEKYFSKYIDYHLDESKRKGLSLFLSKMQ